LIEREKYWSELLYAIGGNDVAQYATLKKMDVIEFFNVVDRFKKANEPKPKK
jgi:hypothetical protein